MIKIFYRPAEVVEGGWQPVGEARTLDDIRDEIDSWQGPNLGHGDLVAIGTKVTTLLVFDGVTGSLVEVGDAPKNGWVTFWEGKKASAASLFDRCGAVDRRRIVLAACAVAEGSLKYVPAREDRPRLAIEAARRWTLGAASVEDVGNAVDEAVDAAGDAVGDYAAYYAAHAASDAASAAYAAEAAEAAAATARASLNAAADAYAADAYAADAADYSAVAKAVRRFIPLSVLACSLVGARDPLPMPRENPRKRRR